MDLIFTERADNDLKELEQDASCKPLVRGIYRTLAFMALDLRHSSLNTHEYHNLQGPEGQKVFEAYVHPGAYRVFWYYGPLKGQITVVAVVAHPNKKSFR
ncbi:MAG: hypothetical protein AB7F19_02995 [Candidatus Babeliales bacterium]